MTPNMTFKCPKSQTRDHKKVIMGHDHVFLKHVVFETCGFNCYANYYLFTGNLHWQLTLLSYFWDMTICSHPPTKKYFFHTISFSLYNLIITNYIKKKKIFWTIGLTIPTAQQYDFPLFIYYYYFFVGGGMWGKPLIPIELILFNTFLSSTRQYHGPSNEI